MSATKCLSNLVSPKSNLRRPIQTTAYAAACLEHAMPLIDRSHRGDNLCPTVASSHPADGSVDSRADTPFFLLPLIWLGGNRKCLSAWSGRGNRGLPSHHTVRSVTEKEIPEFLHWAPTCSSSRQTCVAMFKRSSVLLPITSKS